MDWYTKIIEWYKAGLWTADMVQNAVAKGKITQVQADMILSDAIAT